MEPVPGLLLCSGSVVSPRGNVLCGAGHCGADSRRQPQEVLGRVLLQGNNEARELPCDIKVKETEQSQR